MARKRSKFGNIPTVVDGIRFDSKKEAGAFLTLSALQKGGAIRDLETKTPSCRYPLRINGVLICTYVADFRYYDVQKQQMVVADAKGFRTPVYKLKKKLMLALYNIVIFEL